MNREAGIEETLYRLAVELIQKRYPKGWGGAAVLRTEQDHYLTSVALETANASAELCIGALCAKPISCKSGSPMACAWCGRMSRAPSRCSRPAASARSATASGVSR